MRQKQVCKCRRDDDVVDVSETVCNVLGYQRVSRRRRAIFIAPAFTTFQSAPLGAQGKPDFDWPPKGARIV